MQEKNDLSLSIISSALEMCCMQAKVGIDIGENPFGVGIIYEGQLVSCVHDSVINGGDITSHAEVLAIKTALKRLRLSKFDNDAVLVSTCEPCPICVTTAQLAGIKTIYYGMSIETGRQRGYLADTFSSHKCAEMLGDKIQIYSLERSNPTRKLIDYWESLHLTQE
ncbi:nucleoside deaminase [Vibrio mimicus]|uniref:nucleoside deaminase n=1 Tax=Vibrio mimicus TaxID=674 RepID=UPI002F930C17